MGFGFSSSCTTATLSILFALLFCCPRNNARRTTSLEKLREDQIKSDDKIDISFNIFFRINDLKQGNKIPVYFDTNKNQTTSPHLLSRQEVNPIPFSSSQLPNIIKFFNFTKDSPQAKAMDYTLAQCELPPLKGEYRFCTTSLESMLDSIIDVFKSNTNIKVLSTKRVVGPTFGFQKYTIMDVTEIFIAKMMACHSMPYPYAVYYCHRQERKNIARLFEILLEGENGARVKAVGVCHLDTSMWDRNHVSFRVLKMEPGSSPVCHVFPADNLVWVLE